MDRHACLWEFKTEVIGNSIIRSGYICEGVEKLILNIWPKYSQDQKILPDVQSIEVNYCPFCGLKAKDKEES